MTDGLRVVGFEELSATAVRLRLLAATEDFWAGSALPDDAVRALHDPVFFHQLGGFGAVALAADGDIGYLLGVVSADRLAVVHAVAVRRGHRRRGVASALLDRFAGLAAGLGARAVQGVAVPGDEPVVALAGRYGAHAAPSPDHAGPGEARVLFTAGLPVSAGRPSPPARPAGH
jgi:GNAT superfamily N-acetyltransferase